MEKIEKKHRISFFIGAILFASKFLTRNFLMLNADVLDFVQGMGAGMMIVVALISLTRKKQS